MYTYSEVPPGLGQGLINGPPLCGLVALKCALTLKSLWAWTRADKWATISWPGGPEMCTYTEVPPGLVHGLINGLPAGGLMTLKCALTLKFPLGLNMGS